MHKRDGAGWRNEDIAAGQFCCCSGKQVSANSGSGSSVTPVASGSAFAEGVVVSNQSSLQASALQITAQGTNGIVLVLKNKPNKRCVLKET